MKNALHRQKFLEGKEKIGIKSEEKSPEEEEMGGGEDTSDSPPLFGSQHEALPTEPSSSSTVASNTAEGPPRLSHLPYSSQLGSGRPPALLSSQQSFPGGSQGSQLSIGSTQPFVSSSMFEVVQIQLRKKFNQPH